MSDLPKDTLRAEYNRRDEAGEIFISPAELADAVYVKRHAHAGIPFFLHSAFEGRTLRR